MPITSLERPIESRALPVTVKAFSRWCAPEVILMVTNLRDSETLLFHGTNQAKRTAAKIVLAHLAGPAHLLSGTPWDARTARPKPSLGHVRAALDRMAQRLRWVGIACEPLVLWGPPVEEIPALAKVWSADRVIVTTQGDLHLGDKSAQTVAEQILSSLEVPVCVIGSSVPPPPSGASPVKRVTVALSLAVKPDRLLRFACEFATEHQATLTVLHVFDPKDPSTHFAERTPVEVASRLPAWICGKSGPPCSLEVRVREGNPANEIVKHLASTKQDFLILGAPGPSSGPRFDRPSVAQAVVNEASCPALILRQAGHDEQDMCEVLQMPW